MRAVPTFLALAALGAAAGPAVAGTKTDMAGHWVSPTCETRPGDQHLKRDVVIKADGTWSGDFAFYFDAACKIPTLTFSSSGPWAIKGDSVVAPDTLEVDYTLASASIKVFADGAAGFLNAAGKGACGVDAWTVGSSQDVTKTGCKPLGMAFPMTEPDLTQVKDGALSYGARPSEGGMLKARPTALQTPLVKAN